MSHPNCVRHSVCPWRQDRRGCQWGGVLSNTQSFRRRGAVPLFTILCVFGALFWVRSNQDADPSARELRPSNPSLPSTAIRMYGSVIASRAATEYEIAFVHRAKIVADGCVDDCRRNEFRRARSLGRRRDWRRRGSMPLPTRSCRYPTPLWEERSQD